MLMFNEKYFINSVNSVCVKDVKNIFINVKRLVLSVLE